jgi:hypothetical protein
MRKQVWILGIVVVLMAMLRISVQAQNPVPFTVVQSDPTGNPCGSNSVVLQTPNGNIYTCKNGVYALSGGGGTVTTVATSCGVTGGTITATGTISQGWTVHALGTPAGNAYTVLSTDCGKLLTFNDASAVAVTLPQGTGSFAAPFVFAVQNYGAGTATITPTTSTINNGASSLAITTNAGDTIYTDGSGNYQVLSGGGSGGAPAFNTITSGTNTGAAMVVGSGASLGVSGGGTIAATSVSGFTAGAGTLTGPAVSGTAATLANTETLSNKTVDGVTPTVFGYLDPTSSVQTQLNARVVGPGSSTNLYVPQWSGTGGYTLVAGLPVTQSGAASSLVETDSSGNILALGALESGSSPPAATGNGIIALGESTGQACVSAADCLVADSGTHKLHLYENGTTDEGGLMSLNKTNTGGTSIILDLSAATGATAFKVPVIAGATAGADGVIDYDSTGKNTHVRANGGDGIVGAFASAPTTGHCIQATVSSGNVLLSDSGTTNCGGGGAVAWSTITNPAGNLALTMGVNTSSFSSALAGSTTAWTYGETSAATGTGNILHLISMAAGSTAIPDEVSFPALGAAVTMSRVLINSTAAANGAQQWSPAEELCGAGWKTNATAASQAACWAIYTEPVQGAANPTEFLVFSPYINGSAPGNTLSVAIASIGGGATVGCIICLAFPNNTLGTGLGFAGSSLTFYSNNSNVNSAFGSNGWVMPTSYSMAWGSFSAAGTNVTGDISVDRDAAGILGIYNGTAAGTTAANYRDIRSRHALGGGTVPVFASGFGTSPVVSGSDDSITVNVGTGGVATSGTVTFGTAYTNAPNCVAGDNSSLVQTRASASTTTLTLSSGATPWGASDLVSVICKGN